MKRDKGNDLKSLGGLCNCLVLPMICVLLFLVSCINEINYKEEDPSSEIKSFSLFLPNSSNPFSTRDNGLNNSEGNINTLWLCAFPIDEKSGETKVIEISHFKESNSLNEGYDQYKIELKEGRYNIYVLANLEKYLNSFRLNSAIREADLKSLVLTFSEENYLQSGNLPLIAFGENICYGENKTKATDTGVPITDNSVIYASLQFLCAKVRFTLLFDNSSSGFSKAFENNDIDFKTSTRISHIIPKTPLFSYYPEDATFNIESDFLKRVNYPVQGSAYFDIENKGSNLLQDLAPLNEGTGSESNQKAWQGIVYLPENMTENITQLYFTAQGSEVITDDYYYSIKATGNSEEPRIKRGNFYDIVVKIKNKTQFEISVPNQPSGLYLILDTQNYELRDENQFYTTSKVNLWKTRVPIFVVNYDFFKITNEDGSLTLGRNGKFNMIGESYEMAESDTYVINSGANYTGIISLLKDENGNYTIYFKDLEIESVEVDEGAVADM